MKEDRLKDLPAKEDRLPEMKRIRITSSYIYEIKRRHVLESLLYRPPEAAVVLGIGVAKVYELVKDGYLLAANENGVGSKGLRITALSVDEHSKRIKIDPDRWKA